MVLDLFTYLATMALFGGFVLMNDKNTLDWTEIVFAFYICVSALSVSCFMLVILFYVSQRASV